jgi:ribose 1,5-bisphosphate isomerase
MMANQPSTHAIPVVTVFLHSGGRILLLRRSDRVGSYQGKWAGVSGYVERLPLRQALMEINEETALPPESVVLDGIGIPVLVTDDAIGRQWVVHPFLFRTSSSEAVVTDWESAEARWVEPNEIDELETVPGLKEALVTVWPPFGDEPLWSGLARVALDTTSGATSLAIDGLRYVGDYVLRRPDVPKRYAALACAACRPSMGIFPHLAARLVLGAEISELQSEIADATAASARAAADAMGDARRIVTLSYSSAVCEAIRTMRESRADLRVTVLESRPKLEGMTLAKRLACEGVEVTVMTDASVVMAVERADAVLVGCDAIIGEYLQNKTGTRALVLAAREAGIRCCAVTQTLKIVPSRFPHSPELQDPEDVGLSEGVRFVNSVFEIAPLAAFDAVYTENGVLTSDALQYTLSKLDAADL